MLNPNSVMNQNRYKIYQSLGFQGSVEDAMYLICLALKSLDFVSDQLIFKTKGLLFCCIFP